MNCLTKEAQDNSTLSRATFVSSCGDWLSYFALLKLVYSQTGDPLLAAYTVPLRSLGTGLATIAIPSILRGRSIKKTMIFAQLTASAASLAICVSLFLGAPVSVPLLLMLVALSSFFKVFFDVPRETLSKSIGITESHRTAQAQLLQGLFTAQMLGPIIAVFLLVSAPLSIVLALDALSFAASAYLLSGLGQDLCGHSKHIFRPLTYLCQRKELLLIFAIRGIFFWIPTGGANYLIYLVVTKRYGDSIELTALTYSAIGLGSYLAAHFLRERKWRLSEKLRKISDARIASAALLLVSLCRILIVIVTTLKAGVLITFVQGIGNGANAVTTQSLRRKVITQAEFSEVVAFEQLVARFVEWASASLFAALLANQTIGLQGAMIVVVIMGVGLAFLQLNPLIRDL